MGNCSAKNGKQSRSRGECAPFRASVGSSTAGTGGSGQYAKPLDGERRAASSCSSNGDSVHINSADHHHDVVKNNNPFVKARQLKEELNDHPGDGWVVTKKKCLETSVRYHTHDMEQDYTIHMDDVSVCGSGYSGPVRICTSKSHGHTHQNYAVKTFIKKDLCPKKFAFLVSEVNIYLKLDHPHIAKLHEVFENETHLYLVMEYCGGGELYHRLASKKVFNEKRAKETTYQMLLAIAYLHTLSIAHRDLKLENWLYESKSDDSKIRLIDFGFSKVFEPGTKMHQSCGSVAYVAPEVLRRSYSAGHCDMWSLGVIVFMLLSGYPPFYSKDEAKMIALIESGKYEFRAERWGRISSHGKDFVSKLLVMNEHKRMTADQALRHPWVLSRRETKLSKKTGTLTREFVESFRDYSSCSHLKRAVLTAIAYTVDQKDVSELRDLFIQLDTTRSGTLSLKDFREALAKYNVSDAEIQHTFHALDTDNHNCIDYSHFIAALLQTKVGIKDGLLRDAFDRFDPDHKGFVTVKNLEDALGETFEDQPTANLMTEVASTAPNIRREGCIYYDEFVEHIKNGGSAANGQLPIGMKKVESVKSIGSLSTAYFSKDPAQSASSCASTVVSSSMSIPNSEMLLDHSRLPCTLKHQKHVVINQKSGHVVFYNEYGRSEASVQSGRQQAGSYDSGATAPSNNRLDDADDSSSVADDNNYRGSLNRANSIQSSTLKKKT